jgi:hypothetical protein
VLKHCAAQTERDGFQLSQTQVYIYTTLKFLALLGAPYIYDISRLRVNALGVGMRVRNDETTGAHGRTGTQYFYLAFVRKF